MDFHSNGSGKSYEKLPVSWSPGRSVPALEAVGKDEAGSAGRFIHASQLCFTLGNPVAILRRLGGGIRQRAADHVRSECRGHGADAEARRHASGQRVGELAGAVSDGVPEVAQGLGIVRTGELLAAVDRTLASV